ncbi:MAG: iron ABC transporter permease [Treponema sp.]|nr:iron ABC transporter permease [Treponema sp.]
MKRQPLFAILFFLLLNLSLALSLVFGAEKLSPLVLIGKGTKFQNIILWKIRLPRCLLVLVTGLLLGASGAVFQLFFRNPLAEPGIMGISSGATLGAVIATVILAGRTLPGALEPVFKFISPINLCAFLGALAAGFFVTALAFSRAGKASSVMLLLCGTALGTLYSAISSAILLTSNKELHSIYTWILGSFNGRGWKELIFIAIPATLSIIIAFAVARPLDLLTCGEKTASTLGVEVDRIRIWVLICGALAVSCAVCAGGTIGFVGLIAPHIVRKLTGPKSRTLIPYSMMFGAVLLLLSDTIARTAIAPGELPAGIITSILGVPFFISLCLTKKNS